jgi:hypothetical protein
MNTKIALTFKFHGNRGRRRRLEPYPPLVSVLGHRRRFGLRLRPLDTGSGPEEFVACLFGPPIGLLVPFFVFL